MKFTINKDYTVINQVATVKNAIKEFKSYFTENDLLRAFNETFNFNVEGEILKTEIEAFASSVFMDNVTFWIKLFVYDDFLEFNEIHFYIDYENYNFIVNNNSEIIDTYTFKRA